MDSQGCGYDSELSQLKARNLEDIIENNLDEDDTQELKRRFTIYSKTRKLYRKNKKEFHSKNDPPETISLSPLSKKRKFDHPDKFYPYFKCQWTTHHDAVSEHFCSHIILEPSQIYTLPDQIYALKQAAKTSYVLYKKRECERRKRIRKRLEKEKANTENNLPSNLLLCMTDQCEFCKKLFVTVNLFWGHTLCDLCYFNEDIIKQIMHQRYMSLPSPHGVVPSNQPRKRKNSKLACYTPFIPPPSPIDPPQILQPLLTAIENDTSLNEPSAPISNPLKFYRDSAYKTHKISEEKEEWGGENSLPSPDLLHNNTVEIIEEEEKGEGRDKDTAEDYFSIIDWLKSESPLLFPHSPQQSGQLIDAENSYFLN